MLPIGMAPDLATQVFPELTVEDRPGPRSTVWMEEIGGAEGFKVSFG